VAYLEKREAHMQYPVYQAQGLPIGTGAAESDTKLAVEARSKGSGMRGARAHVNPMLGLRNAVCNDYWDEAWAHLRLSPNDSGDRQQTILCANIRLVNPDAVLALRTQENGAHPNIG
jgi:hypothetical protein